MVVEEETVLRIENGEEKLTFLKIREGRGGVEGRSLLKYPLSSMFGKSSLSLSGFSW